MDYSSSGRNESDTTAQLHFHFQAFTAFVAHVREGIQVVHI